MFGRKKKQAQFNTMDDSRVTVYDFKRRIQCLFESYRSTDYRLYPGLSEEEMKPKIDRHLEALFFSLFSLYLFLILFEEFYLVLLLL